MKIVTSQVKCSLMEMFICENNVCSVLQCFPMFDTCMYQKIHFNFSSSSSLFDYITNGKGKKMGMRQERQRKKDKILLLQHYKAVGHFK